MAGEHAAKEYDIHIEAKIHRPKQMINQVKRERLLAYMEDHGEPLVVFHATMGYGKTVFMNTWGEGKPEIRQAWYHLGKIDNDIMVFMDYLAASAAKQLEHFSFSLCPCQEAADKEYVWEKMAVDFCRSVEKAVSLEKGMEELIFMLDDFQAVTDEGILAVMETMLEYLPKKVRIFISTKGQLPGFVDGRILNGQAVVVTAKDLAFDRDETVRLAESMQIPGKEEQEIHMICSYTEGWPAGIMFIFLYLRQNRGQSVQGTEDLKHIYEEARIQEFLMYNLFRKLPYEIQAFLTGTSLLEYLDAHVCNAVMGIRNSRSILDYMVQEGLFIQKIEGDVGTYRYHSLFRLFLQGRLSEEEKKEKLNRIAVFFLGRGRRELAAEYAILAGNVPILEKAVEGMGIGAIEKGKFRMVGKWLEVLEQSGKELSSKILVIEGLYDWRQGKKKLGSFYLKQGKEKAKQEKNRETFLLAVEIESELLSEQGDYREAAFILREAMEGGIRRYSRPWFFLAMLYVSNSLNFRKEEDVVAFLHQIIHGQEPGKPSRQVEEIKEKAETLLFLLRAKKEDLENWNRQDWFERLPACREIFCWKKLFYIKEAGTFCREEVEEILGELKACPTLGRYGLNALLAAGYILHKHGCGPEGGNRMIQAVARMKEQKDRDYFLEDIYEESARFYRMAEAGGRLREGIYHVSASCFGPFSFTVVETGKRIKWRTKKAKECVALLCHVYPRHLTRRDLLGFLWQDENIPNQEVAALHNLLSSIRKSLSPFGLEDLLQYQDKEYFLKDEAVSLDAPYLRKVMGMVREGDIDALMAERFLVGRYMGKPYLEDIGAVWAIQERSWFERWLYRAAVEIGKREADYKYWKEAAAWFERAYREEPYQEEALTMLFKCLAMEGETAEIHAAYREHKERMKRETGEQVSANIDQAYAWAVDLCGNMKKGLVSSRPQ